LPIDAACRLEAPEKHCAEHLALVNALDRGRIAQYIAGLLLKQLRNPPSLAQLVYRYAGKSRARSEKNVHARQMGVVSIHGRSACKRNRLPDGNASALRCGQNTCRQQQKIQLQVQGLVIRACVRG
jgi:hypothetical protein